MQPARLLLAFPVRLASLCSHLLAFTVPYHDLEILLRPDSEDQRVLGGGPEDIRISRFKMIKGFASLVSGPHMTPC